MINIKTNEEYRFYCRRWLSKTEYDKQIIRELPTEGAQILRALSIVKYILLIWLAINENDQQIICELTPTENFDQTIYYVKIKTGDIFQAETHANVHLQIFGGKTQTDYIQLNTIIYSINTFQCGSIDMFTIQYHDLGKVYYLFS
ncbi:unnamed protein product [Rotaria sp. Silwood1]|nr:unnamed protein product [Rotaria sp. Silwood1]